LSTTKNESTSTQEATGSPFASRITIAQIQEALLPDADELPQIADVTFDVVYEATGDAERFGGDWYRVQSVAKFPDNREGGSQLIGISLGDVAGHGLEAALVMVQVAQSLLAAMLEEYVPPSAVLSKVNQMLNRRPSNPVVTAVFGYLDVREGTFEYATAGQMPPLWVSRDGHAEYLPTSGIPLCVESQLITSDQKTAMPPGSSIVLFSDGLVEQKDHDVLKAFENLRQIAAEECPKLKPHPARDIFHRMWPRGLKHVDDVAILTFTMKNKIDVTPKVIRPEPLAPPKQPASRARRGTASPGLV
jgi:serine phosphatase RsbU (regulator of sigma subunit)